MPQELIEFKSSDELMERIKKYKPTKWKRFCWWLSRVKNKMKFITHENFKVAIPRHLKKERTTWHDRDYLMAHYMFEIMCEFVEKEYMGRNLKWDGETLYVSKSDDNYKPTGEWEVIPVVEHVGEWNEYSHEYEYILMGLYDWWTKDYPELMKTDWYSMPIGYDKHQQIDLSAEEDKVLGCYTWEDIDVNEKLLTLLEIRQTLWT